MLLHVTPADVGEIAEAASAGLLGRAFRGRGAAGRFEGVADQVASQILAAAAARLGRENPELLAASRARGTRGRRCGRPRCRPLGRGP